MRRIGAGLLAVALAVASAAGAQAQLAELRSTTAFRVCADPAAVPLSAQDGSGFENKLAELMAAKLGLPVAYSWFPQGSGFINRTLRAGTCDVVMGYAQGDELVQNTNHYYTSVYGLVTRKDGDLAGVDRLTDPALKGRELGVVAGTPPASHMARAGLAKDMRGWDLFVDRRVENPVGDMLAAVKAGTLDAAVLWGPLAGPLVKADPELQFTPLLKEEAGPKLFYRITMGVRPAEQDWKRELNSLIRRNQAEIDAILHDAGVPLVDDYGKALKP